MSLRLEHHLAGSARLGRLAQGALVALCALAGCTPAWYRQNADRTAAELIAAKQVQAFGHTQPFTIETPADTLRRQLMIGQELTYSSPASLGADALAPIPHWPEKQAYPEMEAAEPVEPIRTGILLTLNDALQVAAGNSRDFQSRKEDVFTSALTLDLRLDEFRNTFAGALAGDYITDLSGDGVFGGIDSTGSLSWTRRLRSGAVLTSRIAVDLVALLTAPRGESMGIVWDSSVTVPLLRGAGAHIVTEPLTQAQRNVVYSLYSLGRFKRTLAVRVASEYLSVLQQQDQVDNAAANYRSLIESGRRARRLADAGRLPEIQVDQARQDELRARDRWISALQAYEQRLDSFKLTLGLPTDSQIVLDRAELERLAAVAQERLAGAGAAYDVLETGTDPSTEPSTQPSTVTAAVPAAQEPIVLVPPDRAGGGPLEMDPVEAVRIALEHRLDLRTAQGQVYDAQRDVVVAADALKAGLTLSATGAAGAGRSLGSANLPNAQLRPEKGVYTAGLRLDLPLERTAEQNAYRISYINLERTVRSVQQLEDQIKLDVRSELRTLIQARESYSIQVEAVALAERRVASTQLFLEAGRAEIRDVLEAQEALVSAQDARTAALVDYRVAELELQRDMGVLEIDEKGLWSEYQVEPR